MHLIICRLCEGAEPFVCPARFRRTYMKLHLQKSHGIVAGDLKMMRRAVVQGSSHVDWTSVVSGSSTCVLTELELDVPQIAVSKGLNQETPSSEGSPDDSPRSGSSRDWNDAALKDVYRDRQGSGSML